MGGLWPLAAPQFWAFGNQAGANPHNRFCCLGKFGRFLCRESAPLFGRQWGARTLGFPAPPPRVSASGQRLVLSRTHLSLPDAGVPRGGCVLGRGAELQWGAARRRLDRGNQTALSGPEPPAPRRRKGGCSYPGTGRQGLAVGASFSAMPGPPARGAVVASAELGLPAAWVGWGREGAVTAVWLTPPSPRLEETSHTRRSPSGGSATLPPSLYGDQALSVRWRLGRNKVSGRNRDEEGRERRETQRQRDR